MAGAALLVKPHPAWAAPDGQALTAEFAGPWGVAFDGQGRLFVSDPGTYRIVAISPDGEVLGEFGAPGSAAGGLNYPTGLAVFGDDLYVCDTNNGRISVWSLAGEPRQIIGSLGIATAKLAAPNGVFAAEKWLWVANTRGHVLQRYDRRTGVMDRAFGRLGDDPARLPAGTIDYRLRQPTAVAADDGGRIYLLDSKHGRILAVDEDGRLAWEAHPNFLGKGLVRPQGLAWFEGALYVADAGNDRILKLDENGLTSDARTGLADPRGIAIAAGRIAVAQFQPKTVRLMDVF